MNFEKINDFSYDNFFVSKSNFLAHKTLININQRERFIFLKGPKKSGKTHLGLIWKNINEAIEFNGNNKISTNKLKDEINLSSNQILKISYAFQLHVQKGSQPFGYFVNFFKSLIGDNLFFDFKYL